MKSQPDLRIGHFTSPAAQTRFLAAYDEAFDVLWPSTRTEADVETRFGTTHVHRSGADAGDPVVLLHGANSNAVQWYPFVEALGAEHPVTAVDTIGDPGRSVPRAAIHEPANSAAWLDEVLNGLGIERAHLVGHSYGGWLALNQAVRSPHRLLSVCALDPGGLQKIGWRFFAYLYVSGLAGLLPGELRRRAAARLDNPVLVVPELRKVLLAAARWYRTRRPAPTPLADEDVSSIAIPLLLLLGGHSQMIDSTAAAKRIKTLLPEADVRVLPGVGHGPGFEHGSTVNAALAEFIDSHSRR